jgi:hypothetical protein
MATSVESRIAEIHKRVEEYHKHENDSYSYYPEEISAVQELKSHALEDIEFILAQLNQKPR